LRRADGTSLPVQFEGVPFVDASPARRCQAALIDVSARREAEAVARCNVEQHRLLFESNPCPMWIFDEATLRFLAVNEATVKLYGWSREQFLRMTLKDIRPVEEVPRLMEKLAGQRESRLAFAGIWKHRKKDGTVFEVKVNIGCIQFEGHDGRLTMVTDISGLRRAEAALQELNASLEQHVAARTAELTLANERLRAIMDTALVGILTLNERGIIQSLNPAAVRIFGHAPAEMLGQNVGRFVDSPDQAPHEDFLAHWLQAGERYPPGVPCEAMGRCKDGSAIVVEFSLVELGRGQRQFVVMLRDITQRKRLERELLEAGDRERQRIGHDLHDGLGQHLHALYYMASLYERELKRKSPARAREAHWLSKHLEQAMELARGLARGLQPVNAVPEGLMQTLHELAERTKKLYRVNCRFECPAPVLIQRHSAANHLYRIAQEAVNNAVKHGRPTRIRVELAATRRKVVLGVRDNGSGIRRRTRRTGGMGLHIMQYRADAMNGSLTIGNLPEGGTAVVCSVPVETFHPEESEDQ
jgi:PAS domain S-box-containing protein